MPKSPPSKQHASDSRNLILSKVQQGIQDYARWLQSLRHHPDVHQWETLLCFQTHWNVRDPDPAAMLERCFHNSQTRRQWHTTHWYPLKMMSAFWVNDPQTVQWMFEDLFNETKDAEARIGRFLFGCDALLGDYKAAHPASVENNHYHGDFRMIALYLAFRYPDSYAPYDFSVFQTALQRLGARDIPLQNDVVRYFKVIRTLTGFLEKEPAIQAAMQKHLQPKHHFTGKTLLQAADFCRFLTGNHG